MKSLIFSNFSGFVDPLRHRFSHCSDTRSSDSGSWIMLRITGKLVFQVETIVNVRHKIENQPPNSYFWNYCGWNILEMKSKILTFRNRFDIQMEIRLSGVAKRLIWEIPVRDKNTSCRRDLTVIIKFLQNWQKQILLNKTMRGFLSKISLYILTQAALVDIVSGKLFWR